MATHSDVLGLLSPPVSVLGVWLVSLVLAVVDSRQLRAAGWTPVFALLGPCVYLLIRALRRPGATSRAGWPQCVVALALTVTMGIATQVAFGRTADSVRSHVRESAPTDTHEARQAVPVVFG
jgi:hypothetical protein